MTIILVTNDDGVHARGIEALAEAMEPLGEAWIVAPDREQSGASHSLTLHHPLRVNRVGERRFSVEGTPTDAVYVGVAAGVLPGRPDLVVSGINHGGNLGEDVTYSGTVSAAMEGTLLGIPSIAFSLATKKELEFGPAARFAARLAARVLKEGMPPDTLLNVNVPRGVDPDRLPYRITQQGRRRYTGSLDKRTDPRGRPYFWIGGDDAAIEAVPGSDYEAVYERIISITPLHLDLTNHGSMAVLRSWRFEEGG